MRIGPLCDLLPDPGGPETAHQIINDSEAELAYLSISTMRPVEICEYPDSKKIGAFSAGQRHMTRADANVDYWTGEGDTGQ